MGFLSGVGDFLGGSKPKLKVKQEPVLNKLQRELLNKILLPFLLDLDLSEFDLPGLSELESGTLEGLGGELESILGGTNVAQTASTALGDILTRGPTDIEDFFQTNVADPLFTQFEEDILPSIEGRFGGQFFGGERRETEGRAREDLIDALTRGRADVALRGREFDTTSQLQASQLAPGVGGATSELLLALQGGAGLPRDIKQTQLAAQSERLRQILAALGVKEFENIAAGLPGQTGALQEANTAFAGGFGQGLGSFAGSCWVAREVYGASDPTWKLFRTCMFLHAPIRFVAFYLTHGPTLAQMVRNKPNLKSHLRTAMDGFIKRCPKFGQQMG